MLQLVRQTGPAFGLASGLVGQTAGVVDEPRDGDPAAVVRVVDDMDSTDEIGGQVLEDRGVEIDLSRPGSFMMTVAVYTLVMLARKYGASGVIRTELSA